MRLIDLQIEGFGKLNNQKVDFSEGINLISGNNEAGKSTVYACIRAMFYGMVRARGVAALTDTYARYKPWFAKNYGAKLRVEDNSHIYRIERDFLKDPVGCNVYDETAMEPVAYSDRFMEELLGNMSEEAYDNTISIGKLKADKDGNLSGELKKYIVNMDTTGSHALNCARAKTYLNEQKRKLTEGIDAQAAKKYAVNCSEIKSLEKDIRGEGDGAAKTVSKPAGTVTGVTESAPQAEMPIEKSGEKTADKESSLTQQKIVEAKIIREEMDTLTEKIKTQRASLRSHNVYSSKQISGAIAEFEEALAEYNEEKAKKAAGKFRVLYIISFLLCVASIVAAAYLYGGNYSIFMVLVSLGIAVFFLALGIAFLALCVISKNNLNKKSEELGAILERYTGYNDTSNERITRVANKLNELSKEVKSVEGLEARLAEITAKADEMDFEEESLVTEGVTSESASSITDTENQAGDATASDEDGDEIYVTAPDDNKINISITRINELKAENNMLKDKLKKNDAINDEIDAIDLALDKLDEIADTMKDSLGVHLNSEASKYIKEITKGAYDSMSIDDDLNVYMNTEDKMVPVEQVSNGTSDQIYMALRLAGARLIQAGSDRLPLLFDDSFVNYDDERLAATLVWLVKEYKGQILIFSCQKREEELLNENGLTFKPIHL